MLPYLRLDRPEVIKKGYEAFAAVAGETSQDVEVYTLRDGKSVRVQVYGDTAMMERHYGKKQVAASQ